MSWILGVLRALGSLAVAVFGLLLVTFLIGRVMPIDPVLAIVGDRAPPDVYEQVRRSMGLDEPLIVQFWIFASGAIEGDFGRSLTTGQPVLSDIGRFFPATFELATLGLTIGCLFGIPAGVIAGANQGRWPDHVVRIFSLVGYSVPAFWFGLVGLLLLYGTWRVVPGPGRLDIGFDGLVSPVTGVMLVDALIAREYEAFRNALAHLILPASLLGYSAASHIGRMARSFMLEQLRQDYVITARVKGLSERSVIWRHAFRNIRVPLLTVVVLAYASLLEGTVLTETVFAWPGIGSYMTISLLNADMNAVLGCTLVIGTALVALNITTERLYRLLDPRIRR